MKDFLSLASRRQSDRAFDTQRPVEKEKLQRILEAACIAPSALLSSVSVERDRGKHGLENHRLLFCLFFNNTPPFPNSHLIIDKGHDQPDCDADTDRPPDPAASQPRTEIIGEGNTDQPEADQAGYHWEQGISSSPECSVVLVQCPMYNEETTYN